MESNLLVIIHLIRWHFSGGNTLRPSETLLFSGLPMMIWQKKFQRTFFNSASSEEITYKKKFCQIVEVTCFILWFHEFFQFLSKICGHKKFLQSSKPSNWSRAQTHGWILLKKRIYCNTFYSICYSEWLALTKIIMIWNCTQKANQNLSRLWPIEAIHGGKDLTCYK